MKTLVLITLIITVSVASIGCIRNYKTPSTVAYYEANKYSKKEGHN